MRSPVTITLSQSDTKLLHTLLVHWGFSTDEPETPEDFMIAKLMEQTSAKARRNARTMQQLVDAKKRARKGVRDGDV